MMNTRSTKRDCTDDLLDDTDERRQPGNVLGAYYMEASYPAKRVKNCI